MNKKFLRLSVRHWILVNSILILLLIYYNILPSELFHKPLSTVAIDENGYLIGAKIAKDEQWRFAACDSVPPKIAVCMTQFEDKRFFKHPGFDFIAFLRAAYLNLKNRKVVSGGSTITMQVIRLMRGNKARTVFEKIIEIALATRLELSYNKEQILSLYASNAPMGGNIVGIDAAAWKYFQTPADNLSWAQAATLAILPNSPALIHPGRNRDKLLKKRNILLTKLHEKQIIDNETLELALEEPVPQKTFALEQHSVQLLSFLENNQKNKNDAFHKTSIQLNLQQRIEEILARKQAFWQSNQIFNAAVLVVEPISGKVLAYVANTPIKDGNKAYMVDCIQAQRSTGSILKPFLYGAMLYEGQILPQSIIPDIPVQFGGFMPKNYNRTYEGAVPADQALARSLNIPAVLMLKDYGIEKFHSKLKQIGLKSLSNSAEHYGLSLILGGSEASLWNLAEMYANMVRILNNYHENNGKYYQQDIKELSISKKNEENRSELNELANPVYDAASVYFTLKAMLNVVRPESESAWQLFSSSGPIAWKTGTSYGFRDAWAIGISSQFLVAVWVGNADGEGRPELTGSIMAAPVLFETFRLLPSAKKWFDQPADEFIKVNVCKESGYLAGHLCQNTISISAPKSAEKSPVCKYHQMVHLDQTEKYQVNAACYNVLQMKSKTWFTLPPTMEFYYKKTHKEYVSLPDYLPGCGANQAQNMHKIESIYPQNGTKIYLPLDWNSKNTKVIFRAAHAHGSAKIFWYINDNLVATTKSHHEIEIFLKPGKYNLLLLDDFGESQQINFEVKNKE